MLKIDHFSYLVNRRSRKFMTPLEMTKIVQYLLSCLLLLKFLIHTFPLVLNGLNCFDDERISPVLFVAIFGMAHKEVKSSK